MDTTVVSLRPSGVTNLIKNIPTFLMFLKVNLQLTSHFKLFLKENIFFNKKVKVTTLALHAFCLNWDGAE